MMSEKLEALLVARFAFFLLPYYTTAHTSATSIQLVTNTALQLAISGNQHLWFEGLLIAVLIMGVGRHLLRSPEMKTR